MFIECQQIRVFAFYKFINAFNNSCASKGGEFYFRVEVAGYHLKVALFFIKGLSFQFFRHYVQDLDKRIKAFCKRTLQAAAPIAHIHIAARCIDTAVLGMLPKILGADELPFFRGVDVVIIIFIRGAATDQQGKRGKQNKGGYDMSHVRSVL